MTMNIGSWKLPTAFLIVAVLFSSPGLSCQADADTFFNPLLPGGADPWVIQWQGNYYYMNTTGTNLKIWKTRDITDLKHAESKVVWTPPGSGPYSHEIWAPELHRLGGHWYIYFAADAGSNESHRVFVLENVLEDPLQGEWRVKGKLSAPEDLWAIDPSVFENKGRAYVIWSGWQGPTNGSQKIFISRLENPWTLASKPVVISTPEFPWEKVGDLAKANRVDEIPHVDVNEGPEILQHDGKIMLIYSASGCWTDYYELGMLTASENSDLLDPSSWIKSGKSVFRQSPEASVYAPGHNTFFRSPDGKEDWILYHANAKPGQGCGDDRSPRAQPFGWKPDGTPDFGRPYPLSQRVRKPSGSNK